MEKTLPYGRGSVGQFAQWPVSAALLLSGLVIACRTLAGPLTFPLRVNSPINAESCFGLAAVLLLLIRARPDLPPTAPRRPNLNRVDAWALLAIVLIVAAAFWRAASFNFLSDDFTLLKYARLPASYDRALFTMPGGDGFYRPLTYVSMALTSTWAGLNPVYWHWAGFALHAMNSILVFFLGWMLGLSRLPACFAAALFAVHASRPEAVVWIAARHDLLATFFVLLALIAFILSWDASGTHMVFYRCASLLAMILGFLSKESSYTFPLLLAIFLAWKGALRNQRAWFAMLPFWLAAAGLFVWRWILFGGVGGYLNRAGQPEALSLGVIPILKTFALRLWAILFFPINWSNQPGLFLGLAMVLYLAALGWLLLVAAPRRALALPLGFLLVLALPPLQQLLIGPDLQKARVLYLPSVAFCLLLATLAGYLPKNSRWAVALAILSFQIAALFHNLAAWEYASRKAQSACNVVALCASGRAGKIAVLGLPRSLKGVYFFANGFSECVEQRSGNPAVVELRDANQPLERSQYSCSFAWNSATDELGSY